MAVSEAQRKILREIDRIPGRKKHSASNVDIQCAFHSENTPSCGIYIIPNGKVPFGYFNCLGCGAHGPWNKLADKLGLEKVSDGDHKTTNSEQSDKETKRRRDSMLPSRENVVMPYGLPFNDEEWRDIPGDLLREIGGIHGFDEYEKMAALFMPVKVKGKLVAVIKARLEKKRGALSYLIQGGNTQIKKVGLFPYDKVEQMLSTLRFCHVVVVEGPRDALKLISKGIPAIAILGGKMWSKEKQRTFVGLCNRYGVTPLVMMDGDRKGKDGLRAGTETQKVIVAALEKQIDVEQINLVKHMKRLGLEELDPATLPNKMYKQIRNLVTHN